VPYWKALGKATVNGGTAVMVPFLCRVPWQHSTKSLPSARQIALGKEVFADIFCRLLGTLGKDPLFLHNCSGGSNLGQRFILSIYTIYMLDVENFTKQQI